MRAIGIDFETHLIDAENPVPKPVCLAVYQGGKQALFIGFNEMRAKLTELTSQLEPLVAHNMKFEALIITKYFPELKEKLQAKFRRKEMKCTFINEKLIDNTREKPLNRYGLDKLVNHYLDIDISAGKSGDDVWRLRYSELDGIPREEWPQEAINYALDDAKYAIDVYLHQFKLVKNPDLSVEAEYYLNLMGLEGIRISKERVIELENELKAKIAPFYTKLEEANLVEKTKAGKYKKNMNIFRDYISNLGVACEYTSKGGLKTGSESLHKYYKETQDEYLKAYLDLMEYEKVLTAFTSRLKQADPKIYTQYNAVVSSGRTSAYTSKEFPSLNIQQMPRSVQGVSWDVRNCFIPSPGYVLGSVDYAGLELASAANQLFELTGKHNMLDILNSGDKPVDMHSKFAVRLKNLKEKTQLTYEDFLVNKKQTGFKEYRQLAKPINLGFPGGIGYDTMRTLLFKEGITPKLEILQRAGWEGGLVWEMRKLRKAGEPARVRRVGKAEYQLVLDELVELKWALFDIYPDLGFFLKEGHKEFTTGEKKYVKNEFGEWEQDDMYAFSMYGFTRNYCTYTQFCNNILMQSPAAIGAKKASVKLIKKYQNHPHVRLLAFIHDEFLFEIKDDKSIIEAEIRDISEIMIDEMQSVLKHATITVEGGWDDCWKKAPNNESPIYFKRPTNKELVSV